jgi:flagellar biogenesis protein FliO
MVQPERAENMASTLAVNSGPILLAVTLAIVFICVGLFVLLRLYKNFQKAKQSQNWMTTTG